MLVTVVLSACAAPPATEEPLLLVVVGPPPAEVVVRSRTTIRVALLRVDGTREAGVEVSFVIEDGAGLLAAEGFATTDGFGLASVEYIPSFVGDRVVTVTAATAEPVVVEFVVVDLRAEFRIVATAGVTVGTGAVRAEGVAQADGTLVLAGGLFDQHGWPVAGVPIRFEFERAPRTATLVPEGVVTDVQGRASVTLQMGEARSDYFLVSAVLGPRVVGLWDVFVRSTCDEDRDCPLGESCLESMTCGRRACDSSDPCPEGYTCLSGECLPVFSVACATDSDCGDGYVCRNSACEIAGPACVTSGDCAPGSICESGACRPGSVLDVSGTWFTEYRLTVDLPIVTDLTGELRWADIAVAESYGLPGFLESIVAEIMPQYTGSWAVDLIGILDSIPFIASELNPHGLMTLGLGADETKLRANEVWTRFIAYDLNLCATIPAEPRPPCARFELSVQNAQEQADLGLWVAPFIGTVRADGVTIPPRFVSLDFERYVRKLANRLAQLYTPYLDIRTAAEKMIDCDSLDAFIEGIIGPGFVTGQCQATMSVLADEVQARFAQFGNLTELEFSADATVTLASDASIRLGSADFDATGDGTCSGVYWPAWRSVDGGWWASRSPIP